MRANKAVLKVLTKTHGAPLARQDIIAGAKERGIPEDAAGKALRVLVESGRVFELRDDRFVALGGRDLVVGRISVHRKGYGFVETPEGDVYVRSTDMNGALHRDVVAVRVIGHDNKGASGQVANVVERANETIVGRFDVEGRIGIVTPTDRRIRAEVLVAAAAFADASRGDIVVARITRYPTSRDAAQGVIEEVVGPEGAPGVDIETIILEHGLRTAFPGEALDAAAEIPAEVGDIGAERRDLRDLFTITVDPPDARDYDDAISLQREGKGWRVWVHIADVSHYVPWGGAIDLEARRRATSVYLVDRVLPMLPEHLSNGVCSLNPHTDRFTLTAEIGLDRTGLVEEYRLYPSVIRSDHRLSYDQVDEWLESDKGFPDEDAAMLLREFKQVAAELGDRRIARGGLDFETVEAKVHLDDDGAPTHVTLRQRTVATNMIEEAMILANEVVAGHMVSKEAPMVFRIHEDPDEEALSRIAAVLREFDLPLDNIRPDPGTFQKIVKHAHGRPEQLLVNSLLLRALKRARYTDFLDTHFGLASEAYTHFTSPIRRYPDLLVHRLLKAQLAGELKDGPVAGMVNELPWLTEHSSEMEREAEAAEDDSVKLKLTELMAQHIGEEFDGVITGVSSFGFFVQLPNTAEGLVHVESMADDYYVYNAERYWLIGDDRGVVYRLGQAVRVRVMDVSISERRIELEPA